MNDRIYDRNHPQFQKRSTSCEMCGHERARHFVKTEFGKRHVCDACRRKYEIPNDKE
jgi:ribosome-binding protein aMBF1 (putative translation factor)